VIRTAAPAHAEWLAAVHAQAFPMPEAWSAAAMSEVLAMPGVSAWLEDTGGLLIARLAADEAEILTLAVIPPARRRGVARALLATAHGALSAAGATRVHLEVSATNAPARTLYAGFGYRITGRRRAYYPEGGDALTLSFAPDRGAATPG
jgi:ribosomal-protein-alanine N-acetyltransferase